MTLSISIKILLSYVFVMRHSLLQIVASVVISWRVIGQRRIRMGFHALVPVPLGSTPHQPRPTGEQPLRLPRRHLRRRSRRGLRVQRPVDFPNGTPLGLDPDKPNSRGANEVPNREVI